MNRNIWKNQKVLITGLTGFKGSWLSTWLTDLGAEVIGVSKDIPTSPSFFEELKIKNKIKNYFYDINNYEAIKELVNQEKPKFCFHLAAQPIVSESYDKPLETIRSNALGTATILDIFKNIDFDCSLVIITSDKCYENVEWKWGYRENDILGGKDPYSISKAMAELSFKAYYKAFYKNHKYVKIATARAGNVIGGGDWAKDRVVPDTMRSWAQEKPVTIRSPRATRPWQHVLEPIGGYLILAEHLSNNKCIGESYNFGPLAENNYNVLTLLDELSKYWSLGKLQSPYDVQDNIAFNEAGLLKLNCDKALFDMKWKPTLNFNDTAKMTSAWYKSFYKKDKDMYKLTLDQINQFEEQFINN